MNLNSNEKAHIYLFLVALIYGSNYTIAKLILDPGFIQPNTFILMRVGAGLLLFVLFFGSFSRIERSDWPGLIQLSVTGVLVNQLLFFNGLQRTSPVHAALIMVGTPILVLMLRWLKQERKITKRNWIGCLLGFGGTALLILQSSSKHVVTHSSLEGDLMVFVNACSYAIYLNKAPDLIKKYKAMEIMKWIFAIGFVGCLPFGVSGLTEIPWSSMDYSHWLSLIFVLVATTFLAYLLNAKALQISTPALVSSYIYLQPVIALGIAVLLRKDSLNVEVICCGLISMYGVYLCSDSKSTAS